MTLVSSHWLRLRRRFAVYIGGNHRCVLMPVRGGDLPGAATDATKSPAAFAERWVAEVTWTAFTGAIAIANAADGD